MCYEIDKSEWHTCKICSKKIQELCKIYGGKNIYYTKVFKKHLEVDHSMSIDDYFEYKNPPNCPCGICNKKLKINKKNGSNFVWSKFSCGRNPGLLKWSEEAKEARKGSGNPMFQKIPWNTGLTKENNNSLMSNSIKNSEKKISQETKKKQSESALKRTVHGYTGRHHSQETKDFLRQNTLRLIKEGILPQTKTKPHIEFCSILDELHIKYEEEKTLSYWNFDVYLIDYNIYIEIDGDYWHSNPKIYPNGPKTKSQKINYTRDISKNKYCQKNNIELYRFWESDILSSRENIICILKKLLKLEN